MTSVWQNFGFPYAVSAGVDVPQLGVSGLMNAPISVERLPTEPAAFYTITLVGLVPGSDIVVLNAGTTTQRENIDANPGASYAYSFGYMGSGSELVDIGVFKTGHVPFYVRNYSLGASNATLPIAQTPDRAYLNP